MQLTTFTDYSFRMLLYLGQKTELCTIEEIATHYKISQNHLVKVAHQLGKIGYIKTTKGRGGGIKLNVEPSKLALGEVVRHTEPHMNLVECFDMKTNQCPIVGTCGLKKVLKTANSAFLGELDKVFLSDLLEL